MRLNRSVSPGRRHAAVKRRTGFTMAEVLVVLVLLAIVGGSLISVMSKQQQFYSGTGDLIELRTQLRQASAIIGNDLRGMSSVGGDIATMTDSSIDFDYTIGTSVVCKTPVTTTVVLPPTGTLSGGNTLSSWISPGPAVNDQVYIFDEGASSTLSTDDTWQPYTISSFTSGGSCDAGFNAGTGTTMVLSSSVSPTILDGAPVRFVRRVHYSLYHKTSGADTLWYLGYCTPACSPTNVINPIAGPFMSYQASTSPDTSGIRITYYDSTGVATSTAAQVARIAITLRGETKKYLNVQGMTRGVYHDSLSMNIALRNRS